MESQASEFSLPQAPRGLCFDRLDFVKTNFSVDSFVAEHQNGTSLETMRDDLGAYLKVLRLAMIDLINKDYANFVNLSATLIGFDKSIEKIKGPLVELDGEVTQVKQSLEEAMKEVSMWLSQRHSLQKQKQLLKYYSQTMKSLSTLDKLLTDISDKKMNEKIVLAERGATEFNQLKFTLLKCETLLKQDQKSKYEAISQKLTLTLNDLLFQYWNDSDEENLLKALITLASLDRVKETELIIRKKAVAPLLTDIIKEPLQRSKEGLQGIYDRILSLLDTKLKLLLTVTQHSKLTFLATKYQFLVNIFWCEIESRLEINLASMFAPGNPKIFYKRYSESMDFIKKLKNYCNGDDTIKLLHNTAEYKSFQKRWNLPVYFQIRFQEIAGAFETSLQRSPTLSENKAGFLLKETESCWKSLQDCWSEGIYIEALAHKFWKLTLQLLLRYASWCNSYCSQDNSTQRQQGLKNNKELISNSINIYIDTQMLLQNMPQLLQFIESRIPVDKKEILSHSLQPSLEVLNNVKGTVNKCIVEQLYEDINVQLKQVSDIPRLYRKTNRNVPTKPCSYIEVVNKCIMDFNNSTSKKLDGSFLMEIYKELFNVMTESYYKYVEEVLISVQKTEESLRRLKQTREKGPVPAGESAGVTDGDKIRIQLSVDVTAYSQIARSLQVSIDTIDKMKQLNSMVADAVKNHEK